MKWIARERPKIDRIACPWLVARFIDKHPEFLYVPRGEVMKIAAETGAIAYDGPDVELGHHGDRCSFDAFITNWALRDPALDKLALIVRTADCAAPQPASEAAGLLAISQGLSLDFSDDREMLRHGMVMYDALHAWRTRCRHPMAGRVLFLFHSNGPAIESLLPRWRQFG